MLARNKALPTYESMKPTDTLDLRYQQLLLCNQMSSVRTEFLISDWLLLVEVIYKKIERANGKQISVTGHNVGALVYDVSIDYPNSVGIVVNQAIKNGQFTRLQKCSYDKIRFDRKVGVAPVNTLLVDLADVGLNLLRDVDVERSSKCLPI